MECYKVFMLASLLAMSGCKSIPLSLGKEPVLIPGSTESYDLQGANTNAQEKLQVILTEFKDTHNSAETPELGSKVLGGQVTRILRESGANLVNLDRGMRAELQKEIQLYEINNGSDYVPPKAANLAVGGVVHTAQVLTQFVPAHTTREYGLVGPEKQVPDQCVTEAQVAGSMSVYKVNPISRVAEIAFEGSEKMVSGPIYGNCKEPSAGQKRAMLNKAMISGLKKVDSGLQTVAASSGQVVGARIEPENGTVYYQLSMKPVEGAKPGALVEFLEKDTIDGQEVFNVIAGGEISCTSQSRKIAYAEIDNPDALENISKGTIVKLKYEEHMKEIFDGTFIGKTWDMLTGCRI